MNGNIKLKYVNEFIDPEKEKIEFAVPDYQRGYKWTVENIKDLMNDIIGLKEGEEYCLMPIITRHYIDNAGKAKIEIVDGQQRGLPLTSSPLSLPPMQSRSRSHLRARCLDRKQSFFRTPPRKRRSSSPSRQPLP